MDSFYAFSTAGNSFPPPPPASAPYNSNPYVSADQTQSETAWGGGWGPQGGGSTGGGLGGGSGERPRCLNCWLSGTECYSIEGFSSCIPCSASGQACSSANLFFPSLPVTGAFPSSAADARLQAADATILPAAPLFCGSEGEFGLANPVPIDPARALIPQALAIPITTLTNTTSAPAPKATASSNGQPPRKKRRTTGATSNSDGSGGSSRSRSGTNSGSSGGRASRSPPHNPQGMVQAPPALPHVAEARVIGAEAIRALAADLLEESFRIVPEAWAPGRFIAYDIRGEFERVGRVMKLLGPVTEALISIRVALGATATMHPAIVPSSTRPDARVLFKGDLTIFGRERAPALRTLSNQAAKLVEDLGALQIPTYRHIALLCELVTVFGRRDIMLTRRYMKAACQHWRKLNARKSTVHLSPSEAQIMLSVVTFDAISTFIAGARGHPGLPELSDDEVVKATAVTGIPGQAFIKPDWYADMEVPSWCELPITEIADVIDASNNATYRMLAVLQTACARTDGTRVPPATYQKVLDTLLRQLPALHRARARWTEPAGSVRPEFTEAAKDGLLSAVTVPENQAHRTFLYWIHSIIQNKLPESSHLVAVNDQVASLVWKDLTRLSNFIIQLRKDPPLCSSYWGMHAQQISAYLDLLPGGQAYLATYVRDGPGKLEVRRFEVETIHSFLKSTAFFGPEYCDRADKAGAALRELDGNAGKTFPEDYRMQDPSS